jgi:glycosyltransferase involved in cell wall biosynthesis
MARVCHLLGHLRFGAGRFIVDLATCQRRRGTIVDVLVSEDAEDPWRNDPHLLDELREHGVECLTIGDTFHRHPGPMRDAAARLERHLARRGSPSLVVHAHSAMPAAIAAWAGAKAIVVTCHGWNPQRDPAFDTQDALALRWPGIVVTSPSKAWAKAVGRLAGVPVAIVPYGFDLDRFPPPGAASASPARIVTIAELSPRKGIDVAMDVLSHLWTKRPSVEWHVFGDGVLRDDLRAFAAAMNSRGQPCCVLHGPVPHAYRYLRPHDVLFLPSRSDNLPVAVIEALLMRASVVATEVGGMPELAAVAPSVWLAPSGDTDALAVGLARAIDMPPEARRKLAVRGWRHARRRFGIARVCDRYERVYAKAGPDHAPRR